MSEITSNNNLRVPGKKGVFFSIRSKMLIHFGAMIAVMLLIFVLVDIYGIPFTTFRGVYKKEQAEVFQNLNLVADLKKERLLRWMKERIDDANALAESSLTSSCVASLLPVVNENIANGVRGEALLAELQKEESYQTLIQQLNLIKETYGVYDKALIADALTGIIIASTRTEDLGMDISLHNSFTNVIQTGSHDAINMDKDQLSGNLELLVSHVIYRPDDEYMISSVLIMHINPDDLIRPMLHTGGGLGQTGEALLVNNDARILTALKFPLADGTTALPFEYKIKARPATLAAQGEEGIIIAEDYRGKKVLAAYRHARITSELGWGLVIKRDMTEVFAHLRETLYYRILISSVCAFLMFVLTTLIARRLTRPIQHLGKVVQEIKEGNLNAQAQVTTSDEVGVLANAFNEMLNSIKISQDEIKQHRDHLEELVKKRTSDLTALNKRLSQEIVERKDAEMTLQESEEQFRCTFDQAGVGIAHIVPNGKFQKMNKLFCDILGHSEEEIQNLTLQDITHYDELEADTNLAKHKLDDTFETYAMEKRYLKKDGTIVWVNLTVSLVRKPDGEPKYFICVVEDITERKLTEQALLESEEKFRTISATANDAIIMADNDGNISYWNKAAGKMFGYSSEEATGKTIRETCIPDRFHEAHLRGFKEFKDSGQGAIVGKTNELTAINSNGTEFPIEFSLSTVKIKGKWNAVAIIRDVTERKKIEEKLRISYKMSSLGELTAGVFHEILNPVNIISSHIQLLLMEAEKGSKTEEDLKSVQEEIKRIVKITDGLLRFSRTGKLETGEVDTNNILEKTISLLESDMKLDNIRIVRNFDDRLLQISGDRDELRQVFLNLITNARDAMPEGGTITVSTENITEGKIPFVRIKIKDTGGGIEKDKINLIFDPFFTTKEEGKGTGLGLSTSYGIIEDHGGLMSVESEVGKGATFTIDLPVKI